MKCGEYSLFLLKYFQIFSSEKEWCGKMDINIYQEFELLADKSLIFSRIFSISDSG